MSHLIRICAGISAAALTLAVGFAFWPQFDRSLAGSRAPVEKPVFVVRATPVKLAAAVTPPATPVAAPVSTPAPETSTTTLAPAATPAAAQNDPALTKLAMGAPALMRLPALTMARPTTPSKGARISVFANCASIKATSPWAYSKDCRA